MAYLKRRVAWAGVEVKNTVFDQALGYASIEIKGLPTEVQAVAYAGVEVTAGESFLILADILSEDVAGAANGSYGPLDINAQLLVNGEEVLISSFNYQAPTGRLGSLLNVKLRTPDINQIPNGATIEFNLLVDGQVARRLIVGGKLAGKDFKISFSGGVDGKPQDEVNFSALDVISDKFTLAPRRSVIMYDPGRVKITDVETSPQDALRDDKGGLIMPVLEPVAGLTMKQVLARAYTSGGGQSHITALSASTLAKMSRIAHLLGTSANDQGAMGFGGVITNIPNYPVRRADFTVEGGWHSGASPVVGMYSPIYFVENNKLFILDPEKKLPYGYVPHLITLAKHKNLSQSVPFKPDANAVILTHQYSAEDEQEALLFRDHTETTRDKVGDYGSAGYTEITTRRTTRQFYMASDYNNILSEVEKELVVETRSAVTWTTVDEATGNVVEISLSPDSLVHSETTTHRYYGELKVGHHKVVEGCVFVGAQKQVFTQTILVEDCSIEWAEDPLNPGVVVQKRNTTTTEGVCFLAEDPETIIGYDGNDVEIHRRYPVLLAQSSGIVPTDAQMTGMQKISTVTETLRHLQGNQYDVSVISIDHLNNTVKHSTTSPKTGNTRTDPYAVRSRSILLRDIVSENAIGPRIPVAVNAFELPRGLALELGNTTLKRLQNPLRVLPTDLVGVDFAVHRGSIVYGQLRVGYTGNYFVTGYAISGNNLGRQGHRIQMSLETAELLAL